MVLSRFRRMLEARTGLAVFRHGLPHGTLLSRDFGRMQLTPQIIFDVGANVGQSALEFTSAWPDALIFSFEPVEDTFNRLEHNTSRLTNVRRFQMALGTERGTREIFLTDASETSTFRPERNSKESGRTEQVGMTTLDAFCKEQEITRIDFLKIDTEGFDREVLEGGRIMLDEERIIAILTEIGFEETGGFVPFSEMEAWLRPFGYRLAGFYEQNVIESTSILFRANALFVLESHRH